ncbi:MAG TPA: dephospho-CoA kinase [Opitutaceae bacterium]|nr:dephospho-CoA kinase [Opitutaceae bacterium]
MIVGLTGGMGCGKTTAAGMLAGHGFVPLDSDAIIRTVVLSDPEVIAKIREHFGAGVLTEAGGVDRRQVARRVFADGAELDWLEGVLHPRLYAYWRVAFASERTKPWVVEVPLLFEKSLQNWFDFTVCVASHPAIQIARLEQRGLPPPLARQRISLQLPLAQKIELVDFVLLNDGSSDFLREQVARLVTLLPTQ